MLRLRIDATPLKHTSEESQFWQARIRATILHALLNAARKEVVDLARATRRSIIVKNRDGSRHVHMQDVWTVAQTANGIVIRNPAPYAGFEGQEPIDGFGDRVARYHNRELRAELDQLPDKMGQYVADELQNTPPVL